MAALRYLVQLHAEVEVTIGSIIIAGREAVIRSNGQAEDFDVAIQDYLRQQTTYEHGPSVSATVRVLHAISECSADCRLPFSPLTRYFAARCNRRGRMGARRSRVQIPPPLFHFDANPRGRHAIGLADLFCAKNARADGFN